VKISQPNTKRPSLLETSGKFWVCCDYWFTALLTEKYMCPIVRLETFVRIYRS